jgi:hypothetical protein
MEQSSHSKPSSVNTTPRRTLTVARQFIATRSAAV